MKPERRQALKQAVSVEQKRRRIADSKIREVPMIAGSGEEFGEALLTLATQLRERNPVMQLHEVHDEMLSLMGIADSEGFDRNGDIPLRSAPKSARIV